MKKNLYSWFAAFIAIILFLSSCKKNEPVLCNCSPDNLVINASKYSSGFNSPRGLKFGPDGYLYVAEAGIGGSNMTTCTQVVPPVGPYLGSQTGSCISRVGRDGIREIFANNLPSSQTSAETGSDVQGVGDVAFIGNDLYALLAGAGCSHGIPSSPTGVPVVPNGVVKINHDGKWSLVANLSVYTMTHPTAHPEPHGGAEPDGTPYAMINVDGNLYVTEPNQGDFVKITPEGEITRVVDISVSQGHIVPTAVTFLDDNFLIGNLDTFPVVAGRSEIYRISPDKNVQPIISGFTTILGVVHDEFGRLYILENSTVSGMGPTPGTGDVVRVDYTGNKEVIVSGLSLPTGLTFGPDGKLYISNKGFGPGTTGGGEILQVDLEHCTVASPGLNLKN